MVLVVWVIIVVFVRVSWFLLLVLVILDVLCCINFFDGVIVLVFVVWIGI